MNITHTMDLNELAERMGRDATKADAIFMRDLLISHEQFSTLEDISEDDWLALLDQVGAKAEEVASLMPATKARSIECLAINAADATGLAEVRAIAKDDDWDEGTTTYTFDDNSQLIISGPTYHAL